MSVEEVLRVVRDHTLWRRFNCINLVASENVMSPLAERIYLNDFMGRYNEHDGESHYQGTKYAMEIERIVKDIVGKRFYTDFVEPRPLSGGMANAIVFSSLARYGDIFVSSGLTSGAHVSHTKYGAAGVLGLREVPAYFDLENFSLDVDRTVELVDRVKPKFIVLGRSVILFPEPIGELRSQVGDLPIIYDAAHVFGLIWGGYFQDPFGEGATIMTTSTHKSFPGPQGGLIIAEKKLDTTLWMKIERRTFPGFVYNHHIHRFPALAITAIEMNNFGREYAGQVIRNARALAEALVEHGFKVVGEGRGYTESHQVLIDVRGIGGGAKIADLLEQNNIIVTKIALPWDKPKDATSNPSGIRIGVQEMTRFGMKEEEMKVIAEFFDNIINRKKNVKNEVAEFRARYREIKYCFGVKDYESYLVELS